MNIDEAKKILAARRYSALEKAEYYKALAYADPVIAELERKIYVCTGKAAMGDISSEKQRLSFIEQRNALLKQHGMDYKMLSPCFYCNKCSDTGYLPSGKKCECLQSLISEDNRKSCFSPLMTFDSFLPEKQDEQSYAKCLRYAEGKSKNNLLVVGKTGSGKTHMLNAIGNRLFAQGADVLYYTAFSLNRKFIEINTACDVVTQSKIWNKLLNVDYLFIDDLGTEQTYNNITLPCFYNLYNERSFGKHTVTATNLNFESLLRLYTDRIYSRIIDRSITELAHFKAADHRIPKASKQ